MDARTAVELTREGYITTLSTPETKFDRISACASIQDSPLIDSGRRRLLLWWWSGEACAKTAPGCQHMRALYRHVRPVSQYVNSQSGK